MAALDLHPGTSLDDLLRRAVAAWRERHGVSARRFGAEVLGDPGFVFSQERGRSVRLGTADRVLVFMGLAPLGPGFRREVEAFLEVTGAKASLLGAEAAGNRSLVGRLRQGASPRLRTVDRVRAWMAMRAWKRWAPSAPGSGRTTIFSRPRGLDQRRPRYRRRGPESTWKRREGKECTRTARSI